MKYYIDYGAKIVPMEAYREPLDEIDEGACGEVPGLPRGRWMKHVYGKDSNGNAVTVALLCQGGHYICDGEVKNAGSIIIMEIYVPSDYIISQIETPDIIMSALKELKIPHMPTREYIAALLNRAAKDRA